MTDMSNTTGRTDAVRDGRHLMQQDETFGVRFLPDSAVFVPPVWTTALTIAPRSVLTVGSTCSIANSGYWGDPSMFDAPEHPNYRYGPTVTT
jgi:hypothetical protein